MFSSNITPVGIDYLMYVSPATKKMQQANYTLKIGITQQISNSL
ncbi:hypothetical protein POKO110462_12475 [Pontibacter korlensis]